jgi:hypothetical protein
VRALSSVPGGAVRAMPGNYPAGPATNAVFSDAGHEIGVR